MGEAECILARDVQLGGWSYVCGGGLNCFFLFFCFFGRGAQGSAVQIQPRRQGKWGGMIEGSEGNVFIMTSPSLLLVNPLRGSSLH